MIDGEGCVWSRPGHSLRQIQICNTDPDLIAATLACCAALDIHAYVLERNPPPPRKRNWAVYITGRRGLARVAEVVPIQSGAKRAALAVILASYVRRDSDFYTMSHQEARRRGDEALRLRGEGLTWRAIGEKLGCHESTACVAAGKAARRADGGAEGSCPETGAQPIRSQRAARMEQRR